MVGFETGSSCNETHKQLATGYIFFYGEVVKNLRDWWAVMQNTYNSYFFQRGQYQLLSSTLFPTVNTITSVDIFGK